MQQFMTGLSLADLGDPFARGATAEVFRFDDRWAVKLFYLSFPEQLIKSEAQWARFAHEAGISTPAVEGSLMVEGRHGIVFEYQSGPSLIVAALASPEAGQLAALEMAELHASIHSAPLPTAAAGLPTIKSIAEEAIASNRYLNAEQRMRLLSELNGLPNGNAFGHFDLHPDNIVVTPQGPKVVDWNNAALCDSLADVAQTALLLGGIAVPHHVANHAAIELMRHEFNQIYLDRYLKLTTASRSAIDQWLPTLGALRLSLGVDSERAVLLEIIETGRLPER